MANKAHTATLNRICHKLGLRPASDGKFDIQTAEFIVEVETSATLADAVERLRSEELPCYIAVTNNEGIRLARSQVAGTAIGIMDPRGNIVVESQLCPQPAAVRQ